MTKEIKNDVWKCILLPHSDALLCTHIKHPNMWIELGTGGWRVSDEIAKGIMKRR